jgi:hypothetical protein
MSTHVKVARYVLTHTGKEVVLDLNEGGEAQIWDRSTWERYNDFVQQNPSVRGSIYYPWTYVEDINNPPQDFNGALRPQKTGGSELNIKN